MSNNCTNPPHFPPHCGCPAGYVQRWGQCEHPAIYWDKDGVRRCTECHMPL